MSMLGQTSNADDQFSQLSQKVDSLEHELSYMKLSYALDALNNAITIFNNKVYTKAIEIQLNIYTGNFDAKLSEAYKKYFDACINEKQSLNELIEAKKTFFVVKVYSYQFSELELDTLLANYNVINSVYEELESSMNLLRITIDAYTKLM